jgi:ornithine cyclodeaminase
MLILDATQIAALVPIRRMIEALRSAFADVCVAPIRQVLPVPGGENTRQLLIMPAFDKAGAGVVKLSMIFPDNRSRGLPTIQGALVVFSEEGVPVAVLDGGAATRLRTAAASACASGYLSRDDSSNLLIIGSGALAPHMAQAHCAVRPIRRVGFWGRHPQRVAAAVGAARALIGAEVEVFAHRLLEPAVAGADIICSVTSSEQPVLLGHWLKAGTFVDLVGSFSPIRREADDEVLRRSRIFVDTIDGALAEAGDILEPLSRGVITRQAIVGELSDLVCGRIQGRASAEEITLFKSVGAAVEDLAAAQVIMAAVSDR